MTKGLFAAAALIAAAGAATGEGPGSLAPEIGGLAPPAPQPGLAPVPAPDARPAVAIAVAPPAPGPAHAPHAPHDGHDGHDGHGGNHGHAALHEEHGDVLHFGEGETIDLDELLEHVHELVGGLGHGEDDSVFVLGGDDLEGVEWTDEGDGNVFFFDEDTSEGFDYFFDGGNGFTHERDDGHDGDGDSLGYGFVAPGGDSKVFVLRGKGGARRLEKGDVSFFGEDESGSGEHDVLIVGKHGQPRRLRTPDGEHFEVRIDGGEFQAVLKGLRSDGQRTRVELRNLKDRIRDKVRVELRRHHGDAREAYEQAETLRRRAEELQLRSEARDRDEARRQHETGSWHEREHGSERERSLEQRVRELERVIEELRRDRRAQGAGGGGNGFAPASDLAFAPPPLASFTAPLPTPAALPSWDAGNPLAGMDDAFATLNELVEEMRLEVRELHADLLELRAELGDYTAE